MNHVLTTNNFLIEMKSTTESVKDELVSQGYHVTIAHSPTGFIDEVYAYDTMAEQESHSNTLSDKGFIPYTF